MNVLPKHSKVILETVVNDVMDEILAIFLAEASHRSGWSCNHCHDRKTVEISESSIRIRIKQTQKWRSRGIMDVHVSFRPANQ